MIKDGKYRFTLQFGMSTVEEQKAGLLLEQLGKRKSPIVVAALCEYIDNHPEILDKKASLHFHVAISDETQLEEKIRQIIEERIAIGVPASASRDVYIEEPRSMVDNEIFNMLSDLDFFK